MTRGLRSGQASDRASGASAPPAAPFAARIRVAARATGAAAVFSLSALAGFGTEPTAVRPVALAPGFEPRPYAMAYAVREAVAQARAERQFVGVVAALERRATPEAPDPVPVVAYRASAPDASSTLDRFDAFVAGTLALDAAPDVPVPTMRPVGPNVIAP